MFSKNLENNFWKLGILAKLTAIRTKCAADIKIDTVKDGLSLVFEVEV